MALFVDGDGPIAIPLLPRTSPPPAYLDDLPSALPCYLFEWPRRVLVPGAGGGAPVLQAVGGGARAVDAVELQPDVAALARERYGGFSWSAPDRPRVRLHVADPRAFAMACLAALPYFLPEGDGRRRAGWIAEKEVRMSARDMDARTKNGESARSNPRAERWRPVPWEVISMMFTVVMVGAVLGGLTLSALGEVREDLRALQGRVAALERGQAKLEGPMEGLREAMVMHTHGSE